jgi:hypothetical protein
MTTDVPPADDPLAGETLVIVGRGAWNEMMTEPS